MRLSDQNEADLALAALTLTVTAAVAGYEAVRWATERLRTHCLPVDAVSPGSKERRR